MGRCTTTADPSDSQAECRPAPQHIGEVLSEGCGERRAGALRVHRRPDGPSRMIDAVLDRGAVALTRIPPFTMRKKILECPGFELMAASFRVHPKSRVPRASTPLVRGPLGLARLVDVEAMEHCDPAIRFVVRHSRRSRDQPTRNELPNEGHTVARLTGDIPHDVESKVDLLEAAVRDQRDAEDPNSLEQEAHNAHIGRPLPEIEARPAREERLEDLAGNARNSASPATANRR